MLNGAKKRVHLGMPTSGGVTAAAAKGLFRASRGENLAYDIDVQEGSLLAANMNAIWCNALNAKPRPDYFAMQHADIEPEDWWLDKLIAELEECDLDVLGVVSPIKDTLGLTSIAMARPDGNNWRVHGRLSMHEIYRLPETFISDDLGGFPLLLNTGLWVCRFGEWAPKVFFTINDRIVRCPDGSYMPECEPEDWFLSRLFHEQGLKIGCTRKIELSHRGPMCFTNAEPWGAQRHDEAYLPRSVLADREPVEQFPHDVAGWLTAEEGRTLSDLAESANVLEIGCYLGKSTICLARRANQVYTIDPFDGRATPLPGSNIRRMFERNLARHGVASKVHVIQGLAEQVLPRLPQIFDLVFIDGDHSAEAVERDARLAGEVLKPGGALVFHDYGCEPGVTGVVDQLVLNGAELDSRVGSLAVVRPLSCEKEVMCG